MYFMNAMSLSIKPTFSFQISFCFYSNILKRLRFVKKFIIWSDIFKSIMEFGSFASVESALSKNQPTRKHDYTQRRTHCVSVPAFEFCCAKCAEIDVQIVSVS